MPARLNTASSSIPAIGALEQRVGVRRGDEPAWLIEARGRVADREARLVLESRHPICIAELASEVHYGYQSPLAVVSAACAYMGATGVLELIEILTPRLTRWDIDEFSGVSLLGGGMNIEIANVESRNRLFLRRGEMLQAAMSTALLTGREQMAEVLAFSNIWALRAGVSYAPAIQRAVQTQARFLPSFLDALAEDSPPGPHTWAWGRLVLAAAGYYGLPDVAVFGVRWLMREGGIRDAALGSDGPVLEARAPGWRRRAEVGAGGSGRHGVVASGGCGHWRRLKR